MKSTNSEHFDPYHKWLGIPKHRQPPNHYELLGISLDEDDPEVIQSVAEQRKQYVESKRGQGMDDAVTSIIFKIDEAKLTLLNPEMRRDYDQRMKLYDKRSRNRQMDPTRGSAGGGKWRSKKKGRLAGSGAGNSRFILLVLVVLGVLIVVKFWHPWESSPTASSIALNGTTVIDEPDAVGKTTIKPVTSSDPAATTSSSSGANSTGSPAGRLPGDATVASTTPENSDNADSTESATTDSANGTEPETEGDAVAVALKPGERPDRAVSSTGANTGSGSNTSSATNSGSGTTGPPASGDNPNEATVKLPLPVYAITFDERQRPDNTTVGKVRLVNGISGKGVQFNGSTYVTLPANIPQGKAPRTLSAWLKNTGVSLPKNMHVIAYGTAAEGRPFGFFHHGGTWYTYGWLNEGSANVPVDNEWHHHCITFNGKKVSYYFDGKVVAEFDGELDTAGSLLTLGTYATPLGADYSFTGVIDEVRVFDVCLTEAQVKKLYLSYKALPEEE